MNNDKIEVAGIIPEDQRATFLDAATSNLPKTPTSTLGEYIDQANMSSNEAARLNLDSEEGEVIVATDALTGEEKIIGEVTSDGEEVLYKVDEPDFSTLTPEELLNIDMRTMLKTRVSNKFASELKFINPKLMDSDFNVVATLLKDASIDPEFNVAKLTPEEVDYYLTEELRNTASIMSKHDHTTTEDRAKLYLLSGIFLELEEYKDTLDLTKSLEEATKDFTFELANERKNLVKNSIEIYEKMLEALDPSEKEQIKKIKSNISHLESSTTFEVLKQKIRNKSPKQVLKEMKNFDDIEAKFYRVLNREAYSFFNPKPIKDILLRKTDLKEEEIKKFLLIFYLYAYNRNMLDNDVATFYTFAINNIYNILSEKDPETNTIILANMREVIDMLQ